MPKWTAEQINGEEASSEALTSRMWRRARSRERPCGRAYVGIGACARAGAREYIPASFQNGLSVVMFHYYHDDFCSKSQSACYLLDPV